ncbi:MAG TPA: MFS transporter [Gemmatimonadales bacterium]|nr:MFS transporter [Gemmatimonadales bacterium]
MRSLEARSELVLRWLRPHERLNENEVSHGLTMVVWDGIFSQAMATLVGGAFVVAYALSLGASNKVIGILAAIAPLSQLLQLPSVLLIDRLRARKLLTVLTALPSRLALLGIALLPWIAQPGQRLPLFLLGLCVSAALGTISGAAWNPWMRDLIPETSMSDVFSRRLAIATAVSAALGLVAGIAADQARGHLPPVDVYGLIFGAGALLGLSGLWFLFRTPEPRMPDVHPRPIRDILGAPLRDRDFRQLVRFMGSWNFAVNLAAPFVTVYMLRRLEFSLATVVGLGVLSQTANAASLRLWGRLADRFSNKSVLGATGGATLVSTTLWPVATVLHERAMLYVLAILIHVLAGVAAAGSRSAPARLRSRPRRGARPPRFSPPTPWPPGLPPRSRHWWPALRRTGLPLGSSRWRSAGRPTCRVERRTRSPRSTSGGSTSSSSCRSWWDCTRCTGCSPCRRRGPSSRRSSSWSSTPRCGGRSAA